MRMEGKAVIFPILCCFMNMYAISACIFDRDCYGDEARCCNHKNRGICVRENRGSCLGVCDKISDCPPPRICHTYKKFCTTECYYSSECHDGYLCDTGHCVQDETSNVPSLSSSMIAVVGAIGAAILFVCCCMKYQRRRLEENRRNGNVNTAPRIVTRDRTSGGTNVHQNGDVGRLEMNSMNIPPQHEEAHEQIPDPIADGGPPSYIEIGHEPEAPPPSYEEVMRASQEVLHQDPNQQHV